MGAGGVKRAGDGPLRRRRPVSSGACRPRDVRRRLAVDPERLPRLSRLPAARRADRGVQRQIHVRPDGAPGRVVPHAGRSRAGDLPQLLPARRPLADERDPIGARRMRAAATKRLEARPGEAEVATLDAVAAAVRAGLLGPRKHLPPWLFYDARGSALFEEITALPEYYLTRTEREILLEALLEQQARVTYLPLDVSPAALTSARARLRRLRRVTVRPIVARYPEGLRLLPPSEGQRRLVVFLG